MYRPILPVLAKDRRVVTVDLQAHGHTADVDRPLRYESLALLPGHSHNDIFYSADGCGHSLP